MKKIVNFWGRSKAWWVVLLVGILMVIAGFAYWFFPVQGYAVASVLFGWMLVGAGVVQVCVSAGVNRPRGWGWWLAGGVIDMFIGFMLVRSVVLAEAVFPYFIAFVFIFWGVGALVGAVNSRGQRYWWLHIVNGILLLLIGFIFLEEGYVSNTVNVAFLTSLAFIYWGFSLALLAYDMKPAVNNGND
ncbi:MAG: DUF308 domain-containing protein [Muribaculaceae bacterium]|nr:DUF308 domain-containing protein [Muribaculaceae bacterium]MDE6462147.1 DUF308 domain-containing protein [Muribaculaceae bacterium]MDE6509400.1 DUF308 domain-containing protein [Muribaculaceae bacterium]